MLNTLERIDRSAVIPDDAVGDRLDQVLAEMFPEFSRSVLGRWVREGFVVVDDKKVKPNYRVRGGESVVVAATLEIRSEDQPQAIELALLHEDEHIIVLNKAAGLVVHPAAGNRDGTLLNALLHHAPELASLPRAGIVHRLDKLTSGVMVVARSLSAHQHLVRQLQNRTMGREYLALVRGKVISGGSVTAPIGRHPKDRKRMAVLEMGGKEATTHFRVEQRLGPYTLLRCHLETGRTHQIRVHMAYRGYPLVGDPVYGGRLKLPAAADDSIRAGLSGFRRQALHAQRLTLNHPATDEQVSFVAAVPDDMQSLLQLLAKGYADHA